MLLAIDVGNSNIVMTLFRSGVDEAATSVIVDWRITTADRRTVDEFGIVLRSLFAEQGIGLDAVKGIVIASVVPPIDPTLRRVCEQCFKLKPLFIEPGVKTGLPILTDVPSDAGADRIANCVAAYDRFRGPCVVVDMGTATTFDVVSAKGEFIGGAIAPGLGISAEALFTRAARLPRIEVKKPAKVIGTGTVDNLQIGLYYGYIGLVDGILERMLAEMPAETKTIATGGLSRLIAGGSKHIGDVDDRLTMTGLRLIWERNVKKTGARDQGPGSR